MSVFTSLPAELICEILEHAAFRDNTTALVLSLLSSWVRRLVEPLLYHTVVLSSARSLQAFLATLTLKPASFARRRVKHLGVFAMGPEQAILDVLEACQGVSSLACAFFLPGCKPTTPMTMLPALAETQTHPEQHLLGMACRDGWDTAVIGRSVSHLRVHLPASSLPAMFPSPPPDALEPNDDDDEDEHEGTEPKGWDRIAHLPALTHLALVYRPSDRYPVSTVFDHLQRFLAPLSTASESRASTAAGKLELLLVQVVGPSLGPSPHVDEMNALAVSLGASALRVVAERAPMSAAAQWEDAAKEDRSVWQNAEEVVRQRILRVQQQVAS
ncbi:hypothetical protein BXZ70DRAFT_901506 [Cristinia sonorae]|uniref:Uncharacterized protein n=1 Tax=Cristinia sonorae TaxID=1940300 RepID=A0A8K0UF20_9AGAR|nr:hypothetical protein BXZ70DRAFT_901506 [Cristinia sonorae]